MLAVAKTVAHGSFGFSTEFVVRAVVFVKKIHIGHAISVQNPLAQRDCMSKTDGPDAMGSSGTSRSRDPANPLGFQASILRFIINGLFRPSPINSCSSLALHIFDRVFAPRLPHRRAFAPIGAHGH